MNKNNIDEESTLKLAMTISKQKTICEISKKGFQIGEGNILDFIMHKVGRATKVFQKEKKKLIDTSIKEKSLAIKVLIDDNGPPEEIKKTESELEAIIEEIVNQEKDKMSTWRLLNDEKPTRAMISLHKHHKIN